MKKILKQFEPADAYDRNTEQCLSELNARRNIEFHWLPGSYHDASGIQWYLRNMHPDSFSHDSPVPVFVCTNPAYVNEAMPDEDRVNPEGHKEAMFMERYSQVSAMAIHDVRLVPTLRFSGPNEVVVQGWNGLEDADLPDEAVAKLVEFSIDQFYEVSDGDKKEGRIALQTYERLGLKVDTPGVVFPETKRVKIYRLCLACGNEAFMDYASTHKWKFKTVHLRDEGGATENLITPILSRIRDLTKTVVYDEILQDYMNQSGIVRARFSTDSWVNVFNETQTVCEDKLE